MPWQIVVKMSFNLSHVQISTANRTIWDASTERNSSMSNCHRKLGNNCPTCRQTVNFDFNYLSINFSSTPYLNDLLFLTSTISHSHFNTLLYLPLQINCTFSSTTSTKSSIPSPRCRLDASVRRQTLLPTATSQFICNSLAEWLSDGERNVAHFVSKIWTVRFQRMNNVFVQRASCLSTNQKKSSVRVFSANWVLSGMPCVPPGHFVFPLAAQETCSWSEGSRSFQFFFVAMWWISRPVQSDVGRNIFLRF